MANGFCTRGLLLFLIYIDPFKSTASYSSSDATNLHAMLFNQSSYNKNVIPNDTLRIKVRYNLQYVNSLDIKTQTLSTTGIFTVEWYDDRLKWSRGYENIPHIYVPEDQVWLPDLFVLNSIHESGNSLGADRPVMISKSGKLVWNPIAMLSTSCFTIVVLFPFDSQYCKIELATIPIQSYGMFLDFLPQPVNLAIYKKQGDWEVEEHLHFESWLELEEGWIPQLMFGLFLKRRFPGHYIMIVMFPTILTALLTFVTFFLPIKSGARIGYILTVVLALVFLLTLFADAMPSSTEYPSVLVAVFSVTLGMAFLLIIITIFVKSLYNKPKHIISPNWMHALVRKLRKLKCKARKVNSLEQHRAIEDGRSTAVKDNVKNTSPLKPYSNKELAEFFDCLLFVVYTVLYILILFIIIPILAVVWYFKAPYEK
ncbi:acetylcholine receptor subunit alpha-1-A-like [Mytilus trossulus]|uniref:acetylcholine receptor subunit alpha-1-A-like n=1 Tax=Mytilus trossulus TaxID=6551 RepID=UPI0030043BDD